MSSWSVRTVPFRRSVRLTVTQNANEMTQNFGPQQQMFRHLLIFQAVLLHTALMRLLLVLSRMLGQSLRRRVRAGGKRAVRKPRLRTACSRQAQVGYPCVDQPIQRTLMR